MIISTLNEWLNESNQGFLEPTEEKLRKFNLDPGKVTINPDGSIDYDGEVDLSSRRLIKIPFRFNKVTGIFECSGNQLVSLEGGPRSVGGKFNCSYNELVSLEGSPRSVGRAFDCSNNRLVSLKGSPAKVSGNFSCSSNQLVSLEGGPVEVGGNFRCSSNQLVSLIGAPRSVGKFECSYNIILYNPTKYKGSFNLDSMWFIQDSSGESVVLSGKDHLKMAFERLEELSYPEVIGIRSGLAKVSLPEDLRKFCQEKIEEYLDKNSDNSFRKGYKELEDEIIDMF